MADEPWPLEAVQEGLLTKNEASKVEQVVHDLLGPDQKIVAVEISTSGAWAPPFHLYFSQFTQRHIPIILNL